MSTPVWQMDASGTLPQLLPGTVPVTQPSAPVRPLSELVLRRDFGGSRRRYLQRSAIPEAQNFPDGPSREERVGAVADAIAPGPVSKSRFSPGAVGRAASNLTIRQQNRHQVQPVSDLWRAELLQDAALPSAEVPKTEVSATVTPTGGTSTAPVGRDLAGPAAISGDELLRPGGLWPSPGNSPDPREAPAPSVPAAFAPLELALNRLLRTSARTGANVPPVPLAPGETTDAPIQAARVGTGRVGPTQSAAAAVQRLEAGGWRFKRSRPVPAASAAPVERVQRALTGLATGSRRPIPDRPRTLLERVLQRDFAGVRVQMASLGPLGIEAAAAGNTVYLDRAQADLSRPDSLALLGHELTHVAAGGAAPLLAENRVQRSLAGDDRPLARPLAPSLTQRLSRQLMQMSLAEEERVAEQVEAVVSRGGVAEPVRTSSAQATSARGTSFSGKVSPAGRPVQRAASIAAGSRSVAALAQRRLATSRFAPVSQSWPTQDFAPAGEPVGLLDALGWRLRRGEQPSASPSATVQRGAAGGGFGDGLPLRQVGLASSRPAAASPGQPVPDFASPPRPLIASATVDLLEDRGWRFKRREGAPASPAGTVQRAAAELHRGPAGGMPLPRRPRTLMERVLQRDFSGVRLQAAGLEPLGVEAAAHGQTVYMQRSALAQLDRPDNLALLGHELTHVAAGTNPPVRRSELNGHSQAGGGSPAGILPLSLPPASQLQRSLRHEESAANQVEQGIQALLSQNSAVQREPLSPRSANGSGGGPVKAQTGGGEGAGRRQRANGRMPRLDQPFVQRRPLPGQPFSGQSQAAGEPDVQRAGQEGSVLDGVSTDAMPVVQRSPDRQTESLNNLPAAGRESSRLTTSTVSTVNPVSTVSTVSSASNGLTTVQRASVEFEDDEDMDNAVDMDQEPDWDQLADKIYPLIKRMLQMERERRPL